MMVGDRFGLGEAWRQWKCLGVCSGSGATGLFRLEPVRQKSVTCNFKNANFDHLKNIGFFYLKNITFLIRFFISEMSPCPPIYGISNSTFSISGLLRLSPESSQPVDLLI